MEILEAYDLTGSLRGAAALAGCDHKTVARLVAAREAAGGGLPGRARRRPLVDPFAEKIEELVDRSRARIRADEAHGDAGRDGLSGVGAHDAAGGRGGEAPLAARARAADAAVDPAAGVVAAVGLRRRAARSPGARTVLFCAWLAWSRFRVVVPLRDKTLPIVVIGLDRTLRRFGGGSDLRADR